MPNHTLFHNPRCSKSRQALQILHDRGLEINVIEYLKTPLTKTELVSLFEALSIDDVYKMIRPKEPEFKQAGLSNTSSTQDVLAAIVAYPKLLERPILLVNDKAVIGRPPEEVLTLIE
ncbi:arsenate reductase (glutaredoxin) [Agaribacter flavus]|uniref:Arsenate reductase n=1 Tax=Agaribacter flavus TaxID=1902781 RepID=A0ABV7FTJ5_9ALTE